MIPKIIHYIHTDIIDINDESFNSWKNNHPNYKTIIWYKSKIDEFIKSPLSFDHVVQFSLQYLRTSSRPSVYAPYFLQSFYEI